MIIVWKLITCRFHYSTQSVFHLKSVPWWVFVIFPISQVEPRLGNLPSGSRVMSMHNCDSGLDVEGMRHPSGNLHPCNQKFSYCRRHSDLCICDPRRKGKHTSQIMLGILFILSDLGSPLFYREKGMDTHAYFPYFSMEKYPNWDMLRVPVKLDPIDKLSKYVLEPHRPQCRRSSCVRWRPIIRALCACRAVLVNGMDALYPQKTSFVRFNINVL